MTNTLHRFGSADSFHDDFIVFAMACKGPFKQENALDGLRRFHLGQQLAGLDGLAFLLEPVDDRAFLHGHPELGQADLDGHGQAMSSSAAATILSAFG